MSDTYTPIPPISRSPSYNHSSYPRRAGPGDSYFDLSPSPSFGTTPSFAQTPFLPPTPPQPQYSPPQSGSPSKDKKPRSIGFQRHRHQTWFRWLFFGGIIVVLVGLVLALFFLYLHMNSERTSYTDNRDKTTISLFGKVADVDTTASKLSIMWSIKLCDPPTAPQRRCFTPPTTISVFSNENCSLFNQQVWVNTSRTDPSLRVGFFDADAQYMLEGLGEFEGRDLVPGFEQSFQTDEPFRISKLIASRRANDLAYPFDHYDTSSIFCATYFDFKTGNETEQNELNKTAEIWGDLTVELGGYRARSNAISSWTITSQDFPVSEKNQRDRFLATRVRRSTVVIVFAGIIWLTNWLITLVVIVQTALVFVWKREMAESIMVVPLTALFSMPAVRSVAPGAPQFGSYYDITGFNVQISIVSFCTAAILAHTLVRSEHVWTRSKPSEAEPAGHSKGRGRRGRRDKNGSSPPTIKSNPNPMDSEDASEDEQLMLQVPTLAFGAGLTTGTGRAM